MEANFWVMRYGVAETRRIMTLPSEVRNALYPYGMKLGPASEEVGAFIDAYRDAVIVINSLGQRGGILDEIQELKLYERSFYEELLLTARSSPLHAGVSQAFLQSIGGVFESNRVWAVCWLISRKYFFDAPMLLRSEPLVEPVNKILCALGLPQLDSNPIDWGGCPA